MLAMLRRALRSVEWFMKSKFMYGGGASGHAQMLESAIQDIQQ